MIGASLFSGIGAPETAMPSWSWPWHAEIERFPNAVMAHRHPGSVNLGDVTADDFSERALAIARPDVLVFGSPCQSFSVAGKRLGLDDPRGNLALVALGIIARIKPAWFVFENVPGLLSSAEGCDFGLLLRAVDELGYSGAWAMLDAQYFGLAQRRERLFFVGHSGDWRYPAAVLLEPEGLCGDTPPRREARQAVASGLGAGSKRSGGLGTDFDCDCDGGLIAAPLTDGFDASEDGTGRGTPLVAFSCKDHGADAADLAPTMRAMGHSGSHANAGGQLAVAFAENSRAEVRLEGGDGATVSALKQGGGKAGQSYPAVMTAFDIKGVPATRGASEADVHTPLRARKPGQSEASTTTVIQQTVAFAYGIGSDAIDRSGEGAAGNAAERSGLNIVENCQPSLRARANNSVAAITGEGHAQAAQAGPHQALRALRDAVGEETLSEWGLGVLAAFWPQEVLRSEVHGRRFRCAAQPKRGLVNVSLSCQEDRGGWSVLDLWQAGCDGYPSQGWQPSQQLTRELGSYLSQLPYSPSPAERFLHDLWSASQGPGVLRQALSAVQEARRSVCGERKPIHPDTAVRRLVVEECEALQGYPRGYTAIEYRGKPAADGPRYKALGNSMAVPVMKWILSRIEQIQNSPSPGGDHAHRR